MRSFPIMMTESSIVALLAGRKTQTRRLPSDWWNRLEVGDQLWVKEGWALSGIYASHIGADLKFGEDGPPSEVMSHLLYRAGGDGYDRATQHWRNPRYMPRWASRLTLDVTAVRRERLQNITEADCAAEGLPWFDRSVINDYRDLWTSLHGPRSWMENPEVVVVSFTVVPHNIDRTTRG